jgi:hypothetical protein
MGAIGTATAGASSIKSTTFTPCCRPSGVHESITETNAAVVEEDPVVSKAEVLLAIVGAEHRLATLALTMSSIACVESSPREDIINARWRNVGGFFGAIVGICRNGQAEHRQRV